MTLVMHNMHGCKEVEVAVTAFNNLTVFYGGRNVILLLVLSSNYFVVLYYSSAL